MLSHNRFRPNSIYHPPVVAATVQVSTRERPTLTLYRDGLANPNGLATELLRQADSVALVAPPATKAGWLAKAWQLHAGGPLSLIPHGHRVSTRFRALTTATLFAGQPTETKALSFVLTPGHNNRWLLPQRVSSR